MNNDLLQPLHQFLEQSRLLLGMAQAGEWESFESLLATRQQGLAALSNNQILIAVAKAGRADEMRELLADIRTANDRIAEVAETSRADIGSQLRQLVQAEKAIDAYKK